MPWEDEEEEEAEEDEGTAPAPPAAEAAARVVDEADRGWDGCRLVAVVAAARVAPAGEARGGGRSDDAPVEEELMLVLLLAWVGLTTEGVGKGQAGSQATGTECPVCGCTVGVQGGCGCVRLGTGVRCE